MLLVLAPPGKHKWAGAESADDARVRYASIADDMAEVLRDENGTEVEAETMVAIAWHESGLRADVDNGKVRGGNRDTCLMQIRPRTKKEASELARDRKACLRRGLEILRVSLHECRRNPPRDRFAAYASGACDRGLPESRGIAAIADRVRRLHEAEMAKAADAPAKGE